jgi:hypothetical protein
MLLTTYRRRSTHSDSSPMSLPDAKDAVFDCVVHQLASFPSEGCLGLPSKFVRINGMHHIVSLRRAFAWLTQNSRITSADRNKFKELKNLSLNNPHLFGRLGYKQISHFQELTQKMEEEKKLVQLELDLRQELGQMVEKDECIAMMHSDIYFNAEGFRRFCARSEWGASFGNHLHDSFI